MVLGSKGRRSLLFRVAARVVVAAMFLAPLRMSSAAAAGMGAGGGDAAGRKSGVGGKAATSGRAGDLATDTPWALGERLVPSRIRPLDGPADEVALARLFDDHAGSGLATRGQPARFRVELVAPARLDAIGIFGRAEGTLSASVEGPAGRADVLRGVDLGRRGEQGRWNRHELAVRAPAQAIVMEWRPAHADAVLPELELWGRPVGSTGGHAKDPDRAPVRAVLPDALHAGVPPGAMEARALDAEQTISPAGAGAQGAGTFTIELRTAPHRSSRAFLVYELSGLPHFTAARRSINGFTARGGFAAVLGAKGGLQVEEIAPSWLRSGPNRIQFLPADEHNPASYRVSAVRVIVVPVAGGGPSDATARDWASLRDGREATGWQTEPGKEPQRGEWVYEAPVQPRALELRLPRAGSGKLVVASTAAAGGGGMSSGEVAVVLDDLAPGWHRVPLDRLPPSSRLAVSLVAGREKGVALSELDVTGSPIPADAAPRLAVTDVADATHFALARQPGGVLQYDFAETAVLQLRAAGARMGPIPPGPKGFPIFQGQQFVIPTSAFGVFNRLRLEGLITVTPH